MNEVIATTKLTAVHKDGKRDSVTIEVGKPYLRISDGCFEEWGCPVSLSQQPTEITLCIFQLADVRRKKGGRIRLP